MDDEPWEQVGAHGGFPVMRDPKVRALKAVEKPPSNHTSPFVERGKGQAHYALTIAALAVLSKDIPIQGE